MDLRPLFFALPLASLTLHAQAETPSELDVITVTSATKTERTLDDSPVSVEVVTERQIQDLGAISLRDVLMETPGVHMDPGRGAISIRGVGERGTLLLIDGRRVSGETSFKYDADRIPASSIERIEIIKGPMSVLYGSDATGGIINIITKKPKDGLEGTLHAQMGSNDAGDGERYSIDGDVRGRRGRTGFSAYFNLMRDEPYTEDEIAQIRVPGGGKAGQVPPSQSKLCVNPDGSTYLSNPNNPCTNSSPPIGTLIQDAYALATTYRTEADIINVGGSLDQSLNDALDIGLDVAWMEEERIGQFISTNYPSAYRKPDGGTLPVISAPVEESLDTERLDLAARLHWKIADNADLNWRSYRSYYEKTNKVAPIHYRDMGYIAPPSGGPNCKGEVETIAHEMTLNWKPSAAHRVLFGAEYMDSDRTSPWFRKDRQRSTVGYDTSSVYAQDEWRITQRLDLLAGLRYDEFESENQTTGNLGLQYAFSQAARVRANYAQGFRAPSAPELFMNRNTPQGQVYGANIIDDSVGKPSFDLKPEESDNFEIGLSGRGQDWNYDLTLFHNTIENRIEQVAESPLGIAYRTFRNISEARIQGLEAKAGYRVLPELWLNAALSLLDAENRETDQRLEFTPERLYSVSADWRATPDLKFRLSMRYVGDQFFTDTRFGATRPAEADAYTLVNLKASYTPTGLKGTELYAGVDNLFDAEVDTILGSSVGPYVYAGLRQFF